LIETCGRGEILSVYTDLVVKAIENVPFEIGLYEGTVKSILLALLKFLRIGVLLCGMD
jgi:hypothetical protein